MSTRLQIEPRLEALTSQWNELESGTKAKGERLFDANRHIVIEQGCDDVDSYLAEIESQIIVADVGTDLTTVNLNLNKQNVNTRTHQSHHTSGAYGNCNGIKLYSVITHILCLRIWVILRYCPAGLI